MSTGTNDCSDHGNLEHETIVTREGMDAGYTESALELGILFDPDWRVWLEKDESRERNQLLEPVTYTDLGRYRAALACGRITVFDREKGKRERLGYEAQEGYDYSWRPG